MCVCAWTFGGCCWFQRLVKCWRGKIRERESERLRAREHLRKPTSLEFYVNSKFSVSINPFFSSSTRQVEIYHRRRCVCVVRLAKIHTLNDDQPHRIAVYAYAWMPHIPQRLLLHCCSGWQWPSGFKLKHECIHHFVSSVMCVYICVSTWTWAVGMWKIAQSVGFDFESVSAVKIFPFTFAIIIRGCDGPVDEEHK